MSQKVILTFMLESRYGKLNDFEQTSLIKRAQEWAVLIMRENNNDGRHLGAHFKISASFVEKK